MTVLSSHFLARFLDDPARGLVELRIVLRQPLLGVEDGHADLVESGVGRMHQDVEGACPVFGLHGRIFPNRFIRERNLGRERRALRGDG